ncbi:hypothetical protein FRC10_007585, partial [Ceratobasidium sp. 414]
MLWLSYLPRALPSILVLALIPGIILAKVQQDYEYRSIQLPVSHLYDNVATEDFDGNGAGYPVGHLPTGQLVNENIQPFKFVLPKWGNGRPDNFISDRQVLTVDASFIREFHVLYAGDWIDGENGAQFEFEFGDASKQVVERTSFSQSDIRQELVESALVELWPNKNVLIPYAFSFPKLIFRVFRPYHNTPNGRNYNITQLHHWSTTVSSFSPLKTIRFPPRANGNRLHIFATTLVPAYAPTYGVAQSSPAISVKNVRLTTLKTDDGDSVVQVTLANIRALDLPTYRFASPHGGISHVPGHRSPHRPAPDGDQHFWSSTRLNHQAYEYEHYTSSVLSGPHEVLIRAVRGHGVRTTSPGRVFRLMPGDDVRVDVGVALEKTSGGHGTWVEATLDVFGIPKSILDIFSASEREVEVEVEVLVVSTSSNTPVVKSAGWDLDLSYSSSGEGDAWDATRESLERHETPRWVPKGYYEEWYKWVIPRLPTIKPSLTYILAGGSTIQPNLPTSFGTTTATHMAKYARLFDKLYDRFIPEFNGARFDAAEWVDLFATAGAKYFVLVTKHHDGFSLFNTHDSTHRSSVHLGPKRDFIGELMQAARERHPSMRKGTYYSMPEWFNPDAGPYGFGNWPGHLARGAFNHSIIEPYTGRLEGKDYLKDIQLEHMRILAEEYETEIMWCDIGGPNRTLEFAAEWYNKAIKAGRQVTLNNRCGVAPD